MKRALIFFAALSCFVFGATASGEVVQKGGVRVIFDGKVTPKALPRSGSAPVHVAVGATIAPTKGAEPPRLRRISIAINRNGKFAPSVVPTCTMRDIQPSTTAKALDACRDALVGSGQFAAKLLLPQQAAFPSSGTLYAFNGRYHGHPAILAHVYGTEPVPTSFTLPFEITTRRGELGTVLSAALSPLTGKAGYITRLSLNLGRTVGSGKGRRAYLSASCPAPKGVGVAPFSFAEASFDFGDRTLTSTLIRTCKVRR
jgi:hypothetical protein